MYGKLMHAVEGDVNQAGETTFDEDATAVEVAHQVADGGISRERDE